MGNELKIKIVDGWIVEDFSSKCEPKRKQNYINNKDRKIWCGISVKNRDSVYGKDVHFFKGNINRPFHYLYHKVEVGETFEFCQVEPVSWYSRVEHRLKGVITEITDESFTIKCRKGYLNTSD